MSEIQRLTKDRDEWKLCAERLKAEGDAFERDRQAEIQRLTQELADAADEHRVQAETIERYQANLKVARETMNLAMNIVCPQFCMPARDHHIALCHELRKALTTKTLGGGK